MRPRLIRYCAKLLGPEGAEDVAQEALVVAWRLWPTPHTQPERWLLAIAKNLCRRDQRRRVDLRLEYLDEPESNSPEISHLVEVQERMSRLSTDERELLIRRFLHDEAIAVIAEDLGVTAQALAVRIHRLRKRIKPAREERLTTARKRTQLWCTACGAAKLDCDLNSKEAVFSCPACDGSKCTIELGWSFNKGFSLGTEEPGAALLKIQAEWEPFYRNAAARGEAECPKCRKRLRARLYDAPIAGLTLMCQCGLCSRATLSAINASIPSIRSLRAVVPVRHLGTEIRGSEQLVSRFQWGTNRLSVVCSRTDFQVIAVESGSTVEVGS